MQLHPAGNSHMKREEQKRQLWHSLDAGPQSWIQTGSLRLMPRQTQPPSIGLISDGSDLLAFSPHTLKEILERSMISKYSTIQYNTVIYDTNTIFYIQFPNFPKTHKTLPRIRAQTPGCFLPGRQLGAAHSNSAILTTKLFTPGPKPLLWSVL